MAPPAVKSVSRAAGWLALAYLLAWALPLLWGGGVEGDAGALAGAFLAAPWIAAPVIAAAAFVGASPTRAWAATFLAGELALVAWTAWVTVRAFRYGNSTAAVGYIFLPMLQWCAVVAAFLFALALGWRMRPDFLKD